MPGVTDVVVIPHDQYVPGGVAVRARTFGQCIDAIRALKVTWGAGTVEGKSDQSVLDELKANEQPLSSPPPGGIGVCQACTSHLNGKAFNPCATPISAIKRKDKITTIEGLAATVGKDLHPMQQAWLDHDVSQCGYCQPGQIMAAVALVNELHAKRRRVKDAHLDALRNVCRCGTYPRIREAIEQGEKGMPMPKRRKRKRRRLKRRRRSPRRRPAARRRRS